MVAALMTGCSSFLCNPATCPAYTAARYTTSYRDETALAAEGWEGQNVSRRQERRARGSDLGATAYVAMAVCSVKKRHSSRPNGLTHSGMKQSCSSLLPGWVQTLGVAPSLTLCPLQGVCKVQTQPPGSSQHYSMKRIALLLLVLSGGSHHDCVQAYVFLFLVLP